MSELRQVFMPFRTLMFGVLTLFLSLILIRTFSELQSSQQRGRFVSSLVREHLRLLSQEPVSDAKLKSLKGWPDDFLLLENWVVVELVRTGQPQLVAEKLKSLVKEHSYSREMSESLERWQNSLIRWAEFMPDVSKLDEHQLIDRARKRHDEAAGYQRIGKQYDATVLYLWSIDLLARFIHLKPHDRRIPEALYLLGNNFMYLRHSLPARVRGDRILNLVSELFPNSVWATQAETLWRKEMRNGA